GIDEGMDVPIYYDPMLAKLITHGKTREEAIYIMLKAITKYKVKGIQTTLSFGKYVFEHEAFTSGNFDTNFVKNFYNPEIIKNQTQKEAEIAALMALKHYLEEKNIVKIPNS